MSHSNEPSAWKFKLGQALGLCQSEIRRTTEIGRRMISASRTNTLMHDSLEELGRMTLKAIKQGDLKWDNLRVQKLIAEIELREKQLKFFEKEVKKLKEEN